MRILKNCTEQQSTHRNIFLGVLYSLSILLFFENSSSKASRLLFIFIQVSMGHAHFSNDEIRISCEPDRPTLLFFSWRTPEKPAMKARLDVCGESPHPLFGLEKKSTFEPKLTSAVAYCRVYWAFISCIKAAFTTQELAHVDQFVRTNKDR